jgi:hypothetical protein
VTFIIKLSNKCDNSYSYCRYEFCRTKLVFALYKIALPAVKYIIRAKV